MTRSDGAEFEAHLNSSPVIDDQGRTIGSIAVISDRTDPIRLERRIRNLELRAETIALLGAAAIRRVGDDAFVTESLETARQLLNADRIALYGMEDSRRPLRATYQSPAGDDHLRPFAWNVAAAGRTVRVDDTRYDRRFGPPPESPSPTPGSAVGVPVLRQHDVRAVLVAQSNEPGAFDRSCEHFLIAMANIVGLAL